MPLPSVTGESSYDLGAILILSSKPLPSVRGESSYYLRAILILSSKPLPSIRGESSYYVRGILIWSSMPLPSVRGNSWVPDQMPTCRKREMKFLRLFTCVVCCGSRCVSSPHMVVRACVTHITTYIML